MDVNSDAVQTETRRTFPAWAAGIIGIAFGIWIAVSWYNIRNNSRSSPELSTKELALAVGIRHWRYTVPANEGTPTLMFEVNQGQSHRTRYVHSRK